MSKVESKHDIAYPWKTFLRDIFSFLKRGRWVYAWSVILAAANQIAGLFFPVVIGRGVNFLADFQTGQGMRGLYVIGATLGALSLSQIITRRWSQWIGDRAAASAYGAAYEQGMNILSRLGGAWHAKENSGNKVKRVQTGASGVENFYRMVNRDAVAIVVSFAGVLLIANQIDWVLSAAFFVFAIIYGVMSRSYIKKGSRYSHAVSKEKETLSGIAFETINNVRTVQTGALITPMHKRIVSQIKDSIEAMNKRTDAFKIGGLPSHLFANLAQLGLLAYAAHAVVVGRYDIGVLVVVIAFFRNIWSSTIRFADIITDFLIMRYDVWRLMEILKEEPYIIDKADAKSFPDTWQRLSVSNVSFTYPDGQQVLKNVSFNLERGKKIGVVGPSGAGKSTLFKLLTREYLPTKGEILLDGCPIQDICFEDYFKNIGVMLQETELFNMTLEENIALSSGRIHKKRLASALKTAHINDFLDKLPKGVKTMIGEKGFKLSGGERQRVGIARSIYHEPEILFFDEATSHLDSESEKKIQEALSAVLQASTAVVIAHRLNTIREMDFILVMHKGQIVEEGTPKELVASKGRFWRLWQEQKL